jgi:hypothetical protein
MKLSIALVTALIGVVTAFPTSDDISLVDRSLEKRESAYPEAAIFARPPARNCVNAIEATL